MEYSYRLRLEQAGKPGEREAMSSRAVLLILLAVLLLVAGIRYRLLDIPMERDEGEYAYAGQLILKGMLPYEHLYNMKLPGIYAAYAVILSVFGQTHTGVHTGLLLINAATTIMVFLLGRRLFNPLTGIVAASTFAVMSVGQSVQGVFANAEHFVILPAVAGLLVLLVACERKRSSLFFTAGLLLGLGFMMKQHGIAFILAGGLIFVTHYLRRRPLTWKPLFLRIFILVSGVMIPYVVTWLVFMDSGLCWFQFSNLEQGGEKTWSVSGAALAVSSLSSTWPGDRFTRVGFQRIGVLDHCCQLQLLETAGDALSSKILAFRFISTRRLHERKNSYIRWFRWDRLDLEQDVKGPGI